MSVLLGLLMIHPRPVCAGFQAWGQALFRLYLPWLQILRLKPGPGGWSLGLHRGGGGRAGRHTPASPRAPSPSLLHKAQVRAVLKESEKLRLAGVLGVHGPVIAWEDFGVLDPTLGVAAHLSVLRTWSCFFPTLP